MRFLLIILISLLSVGCATDREGIAFGSPEWGVEEIIEQRESREQSGDPAPENVPVDLIVIGTVSAFRPLTDENSEKIYADYLAFAERLNPTQPVALSAVAFRNGIAGWTKLKLFSIPMVVSSYEFVLVPVEMHDEILYPSDFATSMVQASGDLLAARTNDDGYFIVERVLCRDDRGYSACADNFHKGLFHGSTGEELDHKTLTPERSGKQIDPITYLAIAVQP